MNIHKANCGDIGMHGPIANGRSKGAMRRLPYEGKMAKSIIAPLLHSLNSQKKLPFVNFLSIMSPNRKLKRVDHYFDSMAPLFWLHRRTFEV